MDGKAVQLKVDPEIVERVLKSEIHTAVVAAMGKEEQFVKELVNKALDMKVDSSGKPCSYGGAKPYIEYTAMETIRAAVKEAMAEVVKTKKTELKKEIVKQIAASKSKLAKSLVDGLGESLKSRWGATITIKLDDSDN